MNLLKLNSWNRMSAKVRIFRETANTVATLIEQPRDLS